MDKPARLEGLHAASDPVGCNRRCRQPYMLFARRSPSAATPCCENTLSRRLVGDLAALWSLLAHRGRRTGTAGGRSAPGRLVRNPSRRYPSHDVGQGRRRRGNLRLGRWSSPCATPDGVRESLMRAALDCPVDRLASGWAIHAALLTDEGGAAYLPPHGPWPPAWNTPSGGRTVAARQEQPDQACRQWSGVHRSPLGR